MDAVSDTCHGVGYYLLQSGLHHFYGLSGYTGRMDLCVHVYIYAHIRWRYLSEPFLVIPEIFVEKALYDLSVGAVCGNGHCAADTDGHRIPCLLPLAAASCAGSYFSVPMLMDYISSFMLSTLCMIGGTMTLLLKEWMIENQRVSQMEKAHVLSEVEQLKEQVSPELLFKTLHHSGELTLTEPEKASKMLMKLSQLLRYQLYDCSRQKVLLSSEIAFLTNYLTLEQSSLPQFRYQFTAEGEVNRMLVPPLLFIPFVQHIMELAHEQQTLLPVSLDIHLKAEKGTIVFTCMCRQLNLSVNRGLERIRQRLDLLYGDRYGLSLTTECIRLELNGGEQ